MTRELSGKIAFVTGSGRGLGRYMAERLAELGADVAIHDMDPAQPAKYGEFENLDAVAGQIARHGTRVTSVTGNIGDRDAVATMKAHIEKTLGRVDILVNCAGGDIGAKGGKPHPNDALNIGFDDIKVTFNIDADASRKDIEAIVAQSQKRSAVYDIITNPTNVTVHVA